MLLTTNRDFRLLFSGAAISNLGDGISLLALPWHATLITRDRRNDGFGNLCSGNSKLVSRQLWDPAHGRRGWWCRGRIVVPCYHQTNRIGQCDQCVTCSVSNWAILIWWTSAPLVFAFALFLQMSAALMWNIVTYPCADAQFQMIYWRMMPIGAVLGRVIVSLAEPEIGRLAAIRLP
jgi:hypothetical protein